METSSEFTRVVAPPTLAMKIQQLRRRRTYLIDADTQFRITKQFQFILIFTLLLGGANMYSIWSVWGIEVADAYEAVIIYGWVVALMAISVTLIVLLCVFFSHRIAGPAFNLSRSLNRIADGDLSMRVKLRDDDFLQDLARGVNLVTVRYRRTLDDFEHQVRRLREVAPDDPEVARCLQKMETVLNSYRR